MLLLVGTSVRSIEHNLYIRSLAAPRVAKDVQGCPRCRVPGESGQKVSKDVSPAVSPACPRRAVTTFITASRAHLRRAKPTGPGRVSRRMRETYTESVNEAGSAAPWRPEAVESRRRWRGSLARFLLRDRRTVAGRCPPRRCPAPRRSRTPPYRTVSRALRELAGPMSRARCADRRVKGHSDRTGTPRIVRAGPSSVKGAPSGRVACFTSADP
jgi:hypothetical protein